MSRIRRIAQDARAKEALLSFAARREEILRWIVAVQQIPAPTFAEAERAKFIEQRFLSLGLKDVWQDSLHNVYGRVPGTNPQGSWPVIISAHSDTVFPRETNLNVRRRGSMLYGPGVGDNSTGVASLLVLAETLQTYDLRPASDVWFVANVGEEGMGDLCGMRVVVEEFGRHAQYIVVEGGLFGQIAHEAIGVRRFRVEVSAPGGHSWGSFGAASAVHELAHLIVAIDRLSVPQKPKTTYNIGVIEGGSTVNSIAQSASMLLDLRSEDENELEQLIGQVMTIINRSLIKAARRGREVKFTVEEVGNRPAGRIPRNSQLVTWAQEALRVVGREPAIFVSGSTDANIPLSQGLSAVCIGITESANSHRLDEYIEIEPIPKGLQQLLLLTLSAGNYREETLQRTGDAKISGSQS